MRIISLQQAWRSRARSRWTLALIARRSPASRDRLPAGRARAPCSSRRMILPLRVLRQVGAEVDLLRRHGRAEPLPRVAQQLPAQRVGRLEAGLQRDERLDDLAGHRVGLADHAGLGDGRVLHQRALDLERADQVARRLDHVVGRARRTRSSRPRRASRGRRSGTSRRRSTCDSAPPRRGSRGTSTASRRAAPARPRRPGSSTSSTSPLAPSGATIAASMPGQRPAHRAGLDVHRREVGDHDPAGLGLPPVVVERQAERLLRPRPRPRGSSGSPTLAMKRSARRS